MEGGCLGEVKPEGVLMLNHMHLLLNQNLLQFQRQSICEYKLLYQIEVLCKGLRVLK